jgi:GGDEF domain-containing protein
MAKKIAHVLLQATKDVLEERHNQGLHYIKAEVGRKGGDEYLIYIDVEEAHRDIADQVAKKIIDRVQELFGYWGPLPKMNSDPLDPVNSMKKRVVSISASSGLSLVGAHNKTRSMKEIDKNNIAKQNPDGLTEYQKLDSLDTYVNGDEKLLLDEQEMARVYQEVNGVEKWRIDWADVFDPAHAIKTRRQHFKGDRMLDNAHKDFFTGVANQTALNAAVKNNLTKENPGVFLVLDIARFGQLNKAYAELENGKIRRYSDIQGDILLKQFANILKDSGIGVRDIFFRIDGSPVFTVYLPSNEAAEKFKQSIADTFNAWMQSPATAYVRAAKIDGAPIVPLSLTMVASIDPVKAFFEFK